MANNNRKKAPQSAKEAAAKKKAAMAANKNKNKKEKKGLREYFKGVRLEMKKVVWPTRKELGSYTVLVLIACAFFAAAFYAIDTGFLAILTKLLGITI